MKPLQQWKKDDLMKFIKGVDKKTWGIIAGGLVIAVLSWIFLIEPAWFARPRLRSQMQSMDDQMRQFRALEQKRVTWEETEKIFSQFIQDTKARIYSEEEAALLLGQISKIAKDSKVDIIGSKPKKESIKFPAPYQNLFEAYSCDFMLQGGYHSLGKFSAGVESYPRTLRIQIIHVVPGNENPDKHVAQFTVAAIAHQNSAGSTAGAQNAAKR